MVASQRIEVFTIQNNPRAKLFFDSPRYGAEGLLEKYDISILFSGMSAKIEVENPPYGHSPYSFFEQMSNNWDGWEGEKGWTAMEGECELTATYIRTGSVSFVASIYTYDLWSVTAKINIEAGQLERLSQDAKSFFGC
jgi:hypothetical protein